MRQKMMAEQEAARRRRGRASTILSGQLGDAAPTQTQRTTLLGG